MSLKNKTFEIILRVICVIFFVMAIFLSVTAIVYSAGGGTPNIFGTNVYLVKTDAFGFLNSGTAVMAKQVPYAEITEKNVVIFTLENGKPALAQVISATLADGVYSFHVVTENNAEITLTQSQIVAKGMSYSDFWGALIGFAVSPLGMLLIAIVPSIIIIVLEIVKFAGKIMPQPEIETVKKQYEVPTYMPDPPKPASRERRGTAEASRAYRNTASLDNSIGIYTNSAITETQAASRRPRQDTRSEYAELAARQRSQTQTDQSRSGQSPLFLSPQRQRPQPQKQERTMPLSSKKLNEAIESTRAEHELEDMNKMREQLVRDIQKTRGAAIAAEKEFETRERSIKNAARKTSDIAKTTVLDELSIRRTADMTGAASRAAQQQEQRRLRQPGSASSASRLNPPQSAQSPAGENSQSQQLRKPGQRPALRLTPEEPVKQYTPQRSGNTTTSIPRLDALLKDDGDVESRYDLDDILTNIGKKRTEGE